MLRGIKDFISEGKKIISRENRKINELHKKINEYETLACVVGQTGSTEQVMYYKEKINQCYLKIDMCLENISNARDRISTMKAISKIVKGSEKCA